MERRVLPFATAAVETSDGTAEEKRRSRALALARPRPPRGRRASHPFSDDDVPQMSLTLTNDALHKVGNGWAMLCSSPGPLIHELSNEFHEVLSFPLLKEMSK